jgi:hypothetical protein
MNSRHKDLGMTESDLFLKHKPVIVRKDRDDFESESDGTASHDDHETHNAVLAEFAKGQNDEVISDSSLCTF